MVVLDRKTDGFRKWELLSDRFFSSLTRKHSGGIASDVSEVSQAVFMPRPPSTSRSFRRMLNHRSTLKKWPSFWYDLPLCVVFWVLRVLETLSGGLLKRRNCSVGSCVCCTICKLHPRLYTLIASTWSAYITWATVMFYKTCNTWLTLSFHRRFLHFYTKTLLNLMTLYSTCLPCKSTLQILLFSHRNSQSCWILKVYAMLAICDMFIEHLFMLFYNYTCVFWFLSSSLQLYLSLYRYRNLNCDV